MTDLMQSDDGKPIEPVGDDKTLAECCERWGELEALAMDTEFMRTDTFYPRLGLIQIADQEASYLIDPLAISDWQPFRTLMGSGCEIVLHSAGEDLVLLLTSIDCLPATLFDTQIAASLLGFGFSQSYQKLVADVLNIDIAKDETRSDWLQRPLTDMQLQYAANDVCYLLPIRKRLRADLATRNRLQWFESECRQMLEQAAAFESLEAWAALCGNISSAWRLDDEGLSDLQRLCVWREREARRRDKPRNWVAKDNDLYALAQALSQGDGEADLATLRQAADLPRKFLDRNAKSLLEALKDEEMDLPPVDESTLNPPLLPRQRKLLKKIQQLSRARAAELNIAPELLARRKEIIRLLRPYPETGQLDFDSVLSGWRREVLENDLRSLLKKEEEAASNA